MNPAGKTKPLVWYVVGLALVASSLLVMFFSHEARVSPVPATSSLVAREQKATSDKSISIVQIAATKILVELATTDAARQKGLSGRTSLASDSGMLFIFDGADIYRFWMPDMHFPLDMIWIQNNKVTDITENVSNQFDPAHPKFYTPSSPAQYVLEVNAGFAKRHGIRVGDAVTVSVK